MRLKATLEWMWFIIWSLVVWALLEVTFTLVGHLAGGLASRPSPGPVFWRQYLRVEHGVLVASLALSGLISGYLAALVRRNLWGAVAVGLAVAAALVISHLTAVGYWPAHLRVALPYGLVLVPFLLGGLIAMGQMRRRALRVASTSG
jgi:hypothetical protein